MEDFRLSEWCRWGYLSQGSNINGELLRIHSRKGLIVKIAVKAVEIDDFPSPENASAPTRKMPKEHLQSCMWLQIVKPLRFNSLRRWAVGWRWHRCMIIYY